MYGKIIMKCQKSYMKHHILSFHIPKCPFWKKKDISTHIYDIL